MNHIIFGTIEDSYKVISREPYKSEEIKEYSGNIIKYQPGDIRNSDMGDTRTHVQVWIKTGDKSGEGYFITHRVIDNYIVNKSNKL